jgi:hypothetical protein
LYEILGHFTKYFYHPIGSGRPNLQPRGGSKHSRNLKGEGLRYLIDRDPIAKSHLDKYQKNSSHLLMTAGIGTAGTLLAVSGFVVNSNKETKRNLIIGGLGVLLVNYLMAKTLDYTNEENLNMAVDEYNRRNTPTIYFGPTIGVEVNKSF